MRVSRVIAIAAALMLALASTVHAQDGEQSYLDARRALNQQDFDRAIAGFQALRSDYPDSPLVGDSLYWEAFALERTGNAEQAVEILDTLLRDHPNAALLDDARAARLRICSELATRGNAECAEAVASAVRDPSRLEEATRMAAVNALINMQAERAVPIAARVALNRTQPVAVRRQALFVLATKAEDARVEAEAREALESVALDETDHPHVRSQAVFWLSRIPGEDTLATLSSLVSGAGDPEVGDRAVFAIAQHGTPQAMTLLQTLAEDETLDLELRKRAIFWIGNRGQQQGLPFLTQLHGELTDEELKRQVLFAVSQTGADGAIEWLVARAEDGDESIEIRRQSLFWAAQAGLSIEALTSLYERSAEVPLRQHLIWLIAQQGGDGSIERLIQIARDDPDPDLRRRAVFWLGNSNDPRAAEYLLELLEQ